MPSHPSRRGRAGKKRKLPLAGCFPLSNKMLDKSLRSWRLDSIWDAGASVKSISGGCLGAWQKAGSVQEFIFRNCCPMAPVCLFATFHPVLQISQPSGQCYVFCHKVLRNILCLLSKQQQGRVLLVVKVHNTEPADKKTILIWGQTIT